MKLQLTTGIQLCCCINRSFNKIDEKCKKKKKIPYDVTCINETTSFEAILHDNNEYHHVRLFLMTSK